MKKGRYHQCQFTKTGSTSHVLWLWRLQSEAVQDHLFCSFTSDMDRNVVYSVSVLCLVTYCILYGNACKKC
ncbi:hypothetical protein GBAR_LOCUS6025 [Geodia barretti]|uniref:Uncharacterized protein n=1 Tax=Geodia barretti TaxID=519541 RepID=A0AA35WD24_GEOBA|nr:hypothetical protein GBAR_LOCUS6025 [Geodia barretti]